MKIVMPIAMRQYFLTGAASSESRNSENPDMIVPSFGGLGQNRPHHSADPTTMPVVGLFIMLIEMLSAIFYFVNNQLCLFVGVNTRR